MKEVVIKAENGLHARPLAEFVKLVTKSGLDVTLHHGDKSASGKSMMKLLSLGIKKGDAIKVEVVGEGAEAVEAELSEFLANMD